MSGIVFSSYQVTEVKNLRFQCSEPALHVHPFHQFFVLAKGGGTHYLNGEVQAVQAPVVLVAPKGRWHLYLPSATAEGWSIGFVESLVPHAANLLFLNSVPCAGVPLSRPALAERLCCMAELIHHNHWELQAADPVVQSFLLAAFLRKLELEHQKQAGRNQNLPMADRLLMERFLALLDEACRHHWSAVRFTRELRCSRHNLAAICQQATGKPVHAALEEHRMCQARMLLVQSEMCIQQIALELGYPDPSYFSKAFHRANGVAPTEYRDFGRQQGASTRG